MLRITDIKEAPEAATSTGQKQITQINDTPKAERSQ